MKICELVSWLIPYPSIRIVHFIPTKTLCNNFLISRFHIQLLEKKTGERAWLVCFFGSFFFVTTRIYYLLYIFDYCLHVFACVWRLNVINAPRFPRLGERAREREREREREAYLCLCINQYSQFLTPQSLSLPKHYCSNRTPLYKLRFTLSTLTNSW